MMESRKLWRKQRDHDCSYFSSVSSDLFSEESMSVQVLRSLDHCDRASSSFLTSRREVSSEADLEELLSLSARHNAANEVIIIPQCYSWGRLMITGAAFDILFTSLNIFTPFKDIVASFGVKQSEEERLVYGCRSCGCSEVIPEDESHPLHEICYNAIYVDMHGRDRVNPWSERQVGVYSQLNSHTGRSRWILINAKETLESAVTAYVEDRDECCPVSLHLDILGALALNWMGYIEYLRMRVEKLDKKASFSPFKVSEDPAFGVSYDDLREFHLLQGKSHRAEAALKSHSGILDGLKHHFDIHKASSWKPGICVSCHIAVTRYIQDSRNHLSRLELLQTRLRDVLDLLSKVLAFRNEELLQTTNQTTTKTLDSLCDITNQGRMQQTLLTELFGQGQKDSAMLKALSVVATVCLPASLIASVFSSSLIQSTAVDDVGESPRLIVSSQFWIYIVITVPLMSITLAWTLYLNHRSRVTTCKLDEKAEMCIKSNLRSSWLR